METKIMTSITNEHIKNGFSYDEFRQLGKDLLAQNKTTGNNQGETYIHFSNLNNRRMDRLDKTVTINSEVITALRAIKRPIVWVVLVELWCGDAAQNVPILAKMAAASKSKVHLSLLLRDDNPEVMDAYLTNAGKSIPKLIALDGETREELFTWGPRPKEAQQILKDFRAAGSPADVDYKKDIQVWYIKDHAQSLQSEFLEIIKPYTI